jgi:tRNA (guanine-N7-)-methyltransferase
LIPLSAGLQAFVIPWTQVDWPLDRTTVFGFDGPLDVEIGFGNGDFLVDLALESPDRQFVGVERSLRSLTRLFARLDRHDVKNVRVIQADASFILDRLFGPEDISRLFVNFPDPWPKERHHGRRLIQPDFIKLISRRLRPGGELMIGTDHADYAEWITNVLESQTDLVSMNDTSSISELPGRKPTKYEKRAREIGSRLHFYVWKRANTVDEAKREERVADMPNVSLEGSYVAAELLSGIEDRTWKLENDGIDVVIKLDTVFREQSGNLLVDVMVLEDAFSQRFGVSVILRPPKKLLVKLSLIGYPRPTWGVKQAVRLVCELLLEDADLRITFSNLKNNDH